MWALMILLLLSLGSVAHAQCSNAQNSGTVTRTAGQVDTDELCIRWQATPDSAAAVTAQWMLGGDNLLTQRASSLEPSVPWVELWFTGSVGVATVTLRLTDAHGMVTDTVVDVVVVADAKVSGQLLWIVRPRSSSEGVTLNLDSRADEGAVP